MKPLIEELKDLLGDADATLDDVRCAVEAEACSRRPATPEEHEAALRDLSSQAGIDPDAPSPKPVNTAAHKTTGDDELLTLKEVREICKVKRTTVWNWINDTEDGPPLRTIAVNGIKRIRRSDLDDFLSRHELP